MVEDFSQLRIQIGIYRRMNPWINRFFLYLPIHSPLYGDNTLPSLKILLFSLFSTQKLGGIECSNYRQGCVIKLSGGECYPLERGWAETGVADQWVLQRREFPGFAARCPI